MKHHHHFQTYAPTPRVNAFWAILTVCAAAGVITVMALYAAGILTK